MDRPSSSSPPLTPAQLVDLLSSEDGADPFDDYLRYHAQRIAYAVAVLDPEIEERSRRQAGPVRLLDVGPGHLTAAIHHRFADRVLIDTLGWHESRIPSAWLNHHFDFDLNTAQEPATWIRPQPHDVVVLAEVLEHLYTAPSLVLAFLATFLDHGGVLILQTPNAVSLRKRAKLVLGRHPYEQIREERHNPGHFREYTADELVDLLVGIGLRVERVEFASYWRASSVPRSDAGGGTRPSIRSALGAVCSFAEDAYPPFRQGLTVIARKP